MVILSNPWDCFEWHEEVVKELLACFLLQDFLLNLKICAFHEVLEKLLSIPNPLNLKSDLRANQVSIDALYFIPSVCFELVL
jgi:hypothetical protein